MALDQRPERGGRRIERVRRDDEAARIGPLERGDVLERADAGAVGGEVDEQDVASRDRPLDAGQQQEAARPGMVGMRRRVEVAIVQRDRQRAVAVVGGALDERLDAVRDEVGRVCVRMRVQLRLDHASRYATVRFPDRCLSACPQERTTDNTRNPKRGLSRRGFQRPTLTS